MQCQAGFGGQDPARDEYYCYYEALAGGYGGRFGKDGPDAVQAHGQNTENAPIEEIEANYPVRITRYELIEDSGGAGQWAGRVRSPARLPIPIQRNDVYDPRRSGPGRPVGPIRGAHWTSGKIRPQSR